MTLAALATVPHTLLGEVIADEGRALVVLTEPRDLVALWLIRNGDLVGVQLDAAGVEALRVLLGEAAERMVGLSR